MLPKARDKGNNPLSIDDLGEESWPKFATHGERVTIFQLSEDAAKRTKTVTERLDAKKLKPCKTTVEQFSKSLDKVMPGNLPNDGFEHRDLLVVGCFCRG